jgi:hypothetical protein
MRGCIVVENIAVSMRHILYHTLHYVTYMAVHQYCRQTVSIKYAPPTGTMAMF